MDNQFLVQIREWDDIILNSINGVVTSFASFLPNIVGALLLLVIGVIISKMLRKFTKGLLMKTKVSKLFGKAKFEERLDKAGVKVDIIEVITSSVYWLSMLVVIMAVADVLDLTIVVETINSLIAYIPNIIAGILVMILTVAASNVVRDVTRSSLDQIEANYSKILSKFAGALVIIFGSVIAITQVGIDITLITANITVIVIGVILTIGLSLGLGSKDTVANIVSGYYLKKEFKTGDKISFGDVTGTIEKITDTNLIVTTEKGRTVVANNRLMK